MWHVGLLLLIGMNSVGLSPVRFYVNAFRDRALVARVSVALIRRPLRWAGMMLWIRPIAAVFWTCGHGISLRAIPGGKLFVENARYSLVAPIADTVGEENF